LATHRDGGIPIYGPWGGKEVEADGKTVVLNSKETIESVKLAVALWKETMDEGGLSWDDSSNNRAFLSGTISATNNGASIYLEAKKKAGLVPYRERQADEGTTSSMRGSQRAPGGKFALGGGFTDMLMGYSKNQKSAKDFLRWIHSRSVFEEWFTSQQGFTSGATMEWEEDPVWSVDPVLRPFKICRASVASKALPEARNRKAAEVKTKIHHRRHVCEGDPRHTGRRRGKMGS